MRNELRLSASAENFIKKLLKLVGVGVTSYSRLEALNANFQDSSDLKFLLEQPESYAPLLLRLLKKSKSQFRQDLFVVAELQAKSNGFFVEFGATNGVDLSNTHLLEKEFGWSGILAEPARIWHQDLANSRNCYIERKCVWSATGSTVIFNEASYPELSTISSFSSSDQYSGTRRFGKTYEVETISLTDLLEKYAAPKKIDYLSIDTEGSEFEILSTFDFDKYEFGVITCEHNFTSIRDSVHDLLVSKGYVRKFQELSQHDDWFVRA